MMIKIKKAISFSKQPELYIVHIQNLRRRFQVDDALRNLYQLVLNSYLIKTHTFFCV